MLKSTILVEVEKRKLSDGSFVFDVHVGDACWHATNEWAAIALQDAIIQAASLYAVDHTLPGWVGED